MLPARHGLAAARARPRKEQVLRATARFLRGQDFPALGNPRASAPLLVADNLLRWDTW
jgi:hypothetical protein